MADGTPAGEGWGEFFFDIDQTEAERERLWREAMDPEEIAERLKQQRDWLEYIYDPTDMDDEQLATLKLLHEQGFVSGVEQEVVVESLIRAGIGDIDMVDYLVDGADLLAFIRMNPQGDPWIAMLAEHLEKGEDDMISERQLESARLQMNAFYKSESDAA